MLPIRVANGQMVEDPNPPRSNSEFFVLLQSESDKLENAAEEKVRQEKKSDSESDRKTGPPPSRGSAGKAAADADLVDDGDEAESSDDLSLADVIASLYRSYPEIMRARQQPQIANGDLIQAYGSFDTKLYAETINEPTGFYENYRHGIGVARNTWWGGYVAAGYRIGRDDFQPWYKERQTDEGGEFKVSMIAPLLQGRAIDANRVGVFQASLSVRAADPMIQRAILDYARDATLVYWDWVAAGAILEAQRELLKLAEQRNEQFEVGVKAGKFAEIDLILNQQLVAERTVKVLETEQKYRATAFKLSLYLRDEFGQPIVPSEAWLPRHFPITEPPTGDYQRDLAAALARRPEPRLLELERQAVELERRLACNQLMPRLDFIAEASQDVGAPASSADDKGEFELVIGLQGDVPIQRRKARGKIQSTTAKMAQISEKLRLQRDKIGTELLTAFNALVLAEQMVEQGEVSLRAAYETLQRYRFAFDRGKIDLIYLNLLESKANETEIKLVESQRFWFASLAELQVALGLDPLDQAMGVSSLPESRRPGPERLSAPIDVEEQVLDKDWEIHSKAN